MYEILEKGNELLAAFDEYIDMVDRTLQSAEREQDMHNLRKIGNALQLMGYGKPELVKGISDADKDDGIYKMEIMARDDSAYLRNVIRRSHDVMYG